MEPGLSDQEIIEFWGYDNLFRWTLEPVMNFQATDIVSATHASTTSRAWFPAGSPDPGSHRAAEPVSRASGRVGVGQSA